MPPSSSVGSLNKTGAKSPFFPIETTDTKSRYDRLSAWTLLQMHLYHSGWPIWSVKTTRWLSSNSFGSWWAASVATYYPGRMEEHPKSKTTGSFFIDRLGHPLSVLGHVMINLCVWTGLPSHNRKRRRDSAAQTHHLPRHRTRPTPRRAASWRGGRGGGPCQRSSPSRKWYAWGQCNTAHFEWNIWAYWVSHLIVDLGWVDLDFSAPPSWLLQNSHVPRQKTV